MKKYVQDYMNLPYNCVIKCVEDESGSYFHATVIEFNGCQSTGDSFEEAYSGLRESMEGWIETKLANGFSVPQPLKGENSSGKFIVRIPRTLHAKLALEAAREGVSLNQYALHKLSL